MRHHPEPETSIPVRLHKTSEYLRTSEEVAAAYLNAGTEESDGYPQSV